jgi:hypothetical protein
MMIKEDEKLVLDYARYLNPYCAVNKAWLEVDGDLGFTLYYLYEGTWNNELGYVYMDEFTKAETYAKMAKTLLTK